MGGLFGLDPEWGRHLSGALVALLVVHIVRRRSLDARIVMGVGALLTFWVLTGLSRANLGFPTSSRYQYPAAVLILIAALGALQHVEIPPRVMIGSVVLVPLVAWSNMGDLRDHAAGWRDNSRFVAAELAALEAARPVVDPAFRPDLNRMPQVFAGEYLDAVDELGSPAPSLGQLRGFSEDALHAADAVSAHAVGALPAPAGGSPPRPVSSVTTLFSGRFAKEGSCRTFSSSGSAISVAMALEGRIVIDAKDAAVDVRVRRWARNFPEIPLATVGLGSTAQVAARADLAPDAWHVRLDSGSEFRVCGLR